MWFSSLLQGLDPKYILSTPPPPPPPPPPVNTSSYSKPVGKQTCLFCLITLGQLFIVGGSFVPHSLDSIVLDHRSFMEARGDLKRAKWVLFSSGLMYSHPESIHLTKKLKVTSKIQFQSVGPLNKINILYNSLQLHQPPY